MSLTQAGRIVVFALAAVAATFLLFPLAGLLSWSAMPLVGLLVAIPVIAWLTLRRMPRGVAQGGAWVAYSAGLAWIGVAARGDSVPQGTMFTAFAGVLVAIIVAFGQLGFGLTLILEGWKRRVSNGEPTDAMDSR
jgi:hypothetical protein